MPASSICVRGARRCSPIARRCCIFPNTQPTAASKPRVPRAVFPRSLALLADGSITLTTVTLLGPHLTEENHRTLLDAARHQSRREVEHIVAKLRPKPDLPASTRKLPEPKVVHSPAEQDAENGEARLESARPAAVARTPVVAPLAPARYKVQFTVSEETYRKLRHAQNLLRHVIPTGDPAVIFDRALTMLVEHLRRPNGPRPPDHRRAAASHQDPATFQRRSGGRSGCAMVGSARSSEPPGGAQNADVWSSITWCPMPGRAIHLEKIVLRCRSHNQDQAAQEFPLFVRERGNGYIVDMRPCAARPSVLSRTWSGSQRTTRFEPGCAATPTRVSSQKLPK